MKTPREILFNHHRNADEKLDAIRENVLRTELLHAREIKRNDGFLSTLHRELFVPLRRAWIGFATVWLFILIAQFSLRMSAPHVASATATPSPDFLRELREQQQLMAELTDRPRSKPVEPNKPSAPQPRSDLGNELPTIQKV